MAIYVDDILITGDNVEQIQSLKDHLHKIFSIKDLGDLSFFLGLEVQHVNKGIILHQRKFSGLTKFQKVVTPLPLGAKLLDDSSSPFSDPTKYRSLVGKLNYLTNTRPDLSFTVQSLSQHMQAPSNAHYDALIHTLHYVHSTAGQGILLQASDKLSLQDFSDSDWASCPNTRRSITGYLLLLGGSPISWKSKKQATVSRSSSEAKYRALAVAASEITWVVRLLEDLGVFKLQPVTLHCDKQSTIHIAHNPVLHERTKHIKVDVHFTRDKVLEGLIQLTYLPSKSQLADVLTKILPSD